MEYMNELNLENLLDLIDKRKLYELREVYSEFNIVDLAALSEQLSLSNILFLLGFYTRI